MNNESFFENNQSAVGTVSSIGSRLKRAREKLNLTITDIARQLRLTEERIASLENDDYQNMPGITFVKGYLRSYARLVNLPADELISDFERLDLMPETKTLMLSSSHKQPVLVSNKSLRWVVYLISIGLLVLAATWWSSSATNEATNLNSAELKRQAAMAANGASSVAHPNASNAPEGAMAPSQSAVNGAAAAANTAPASATTDPKANLPTEEKATSATSQSSSTATVEEASPSDSAQASDRQTKATNSADGLTDENNEEAKPHKKRATRSQFDDAFDDE